MFRSVDDDALERIQLRYLSGEEELRRYFATIHTRDHFPDLIVIDSLYTIVGSEYCLSRICLLFTSLKGKPRFHCS